MIVQTVCPVCFGLGVVTNPKNKCDACFGTGEVLYDDIHKRILPIGPIHSGRQNRGFYKTLNDSIHSICELAGDKNV